MRSVDFLILFIGGLLVIGIIINVYLSTRKEKKRHEPLVVKLPTMWNHDPHLQPTTVNMDVLRAAMCQINRRVNLCRIKSERRKIYSKHQKRRPHSLNIFYRVHATRRYNRFWYVNSGAMAREDIKHWPVGSHGGQIKPPVDIIRYPDSTF